MESVCIRKWKNQIMTELQSDDEIIAALGLNSGEDPDDLVWTRLFPHFFIPKTESEVRSYIMCEINIPEKRSRYGDSNSSIWVHPQIVFDIVVHQEDMRIDLVGESGTRMDYLSELVEKKYEGASGFGVSPLRLKSDMAGSIDTTYRFRELVFEAVDVTDVCG